MREADDGTSYLALVNDEGQYSLWPAFVRVPVGWIVAHQRDTRAACLDYIRRYAEVTTPPQARIRSA